MKPRDYCCCAIPIVNAGVYTTLTVQSMTALLVGILSVSTPSIVGASTPSSASLILAIICFVIAGVQILGFIGVAREKVIMFRRYLTLHLITTSAAFSVAAAWTIVSATRHTTAKSRCLEDFFPSNDSTTSSEGNILCDIFPWVDVGVMGGLWAVLAIFHIYLYIVLSSYGSSHHYGHGKYDQLNNESIPMNKRGEPWDTHHSIGDGRNIHGHTRQETMSDTLAQPQLQPKESVLSTDYVHQQEAYPPLPQPQGYVQRKLSKNAPSSYL